MTLMSRLFPDNTVRHVILLITMLALLMACGKAPVKPNAASVDSAASIAAPPPTAETSNGDRVTLSADAERTAQILVQPVVAQASEREGEELEVPGQVEADPRRIALVSSRIAGRIERVTAVEGDHVAQGAAVAYLYSADFLIAQSDLQQAARRATVLAGTSDSAGARALVDATRRRLRLIGVTVSEIERLVNGGDPAPALVLRAPLAGSVMTRHVLPGAAVEPGAPVLTIADLTVIDVVAEVPERALPLVALGQRATVGIAAFPDMRATGEVERLKDALNPETRTVQAVIHVANAQRRLRPGMFASVRLSVSTRTALATGVAEGMALTSVVTIPESAIITDGERRFVFVETGVHQYQRREVRTMPLAPPGSSTQRVTSVVVTDGLRADERVVVRGAFTLKSELAKASLADDK